MTTSTTRAAAGDILRALIFAGLLLATPFLARLGAGAGWFDEKEISKRATMVLVGVFLAMVGNAIPKRFVPVLASRADAARAQSFARSAGWTWVLAGLALAFAWLVLPSGVAGASTFVIVPAAAAVIGALLLRCVLRAGSAAA